MTIMMIIALIFKILLLIIMTMIIMMMMMMMTTIVVLGKMITIKMIRITQENDRNIMMMMIGNGRFSRTLDPEICVTPWLDRKTSVIKFESEDFVVAFFFFLSLLGKESPIFWISDSVHIAWYKKMNLMSHSILNANLLFVPFFV